MARKRDAKLKKRKRKGKSDVSASFTGDYLRHRKQRGDLSWLWEDDLKFDRSSTNAGEDKMARGKRGSDNGGGTKRGRKPWVKKKIEQVTAFADLLKEIDAKTAGVEGVEEMAAQVTLLVPAIAAVTAILEKLPEGFKPARGPGRRARFSVGTKVMIPKDKQDRFKGAYSDEDLATASEITAVTANGRNVVLMFESGAVAGPVPVNQLVKVG